MPIQDRVAAARQIDSLLRQVLTLGGFKLKYRITAQPPTQVADLEHPELVIDFAGPDSAHLLERGGELLRSFEDIAIKMLDLEHDEHDKISFDCQNFKQTRNNDLRSTADMAAERVRKSGNPYAFSAMNSRERRLLHLAMRDFADLKTESAGEGPNRCVVVYPKDYSGRPYEPPVRSFERGGFRRGGNSRSSGSRDRGGRNDRGGRGRDDRGGRGRGRR